MRRVGASPRNIHIHQRNGLTCSRRREKSHTEAVEAVANSEQGLCLSALQSDIKAAPGRMFMENDTKLINPNRCNKGEHPIRTN